MYTNNNIKSTSLNHLIFHCFVLFFLLKHTSEIFPLKISSGSHFIYFLFRFFPFQIKTHQPLTNRTTSRVKQIMQNFKFHKIQKKTHAISSTTTTFYFYWKHFKMRKFAKSKLKNFLNEKSHETALNNTRTLQTKKTLNTRPYNMTNRCRLMVILLNGKNSTQLNSFSPIHSILVRRATLNC